MTRLTRLALVVLLPAATLATPALACPGASVSAAAADSPGAMLRAIRSPTDRIASKLERRPMVQSHNGTLRERAQAQRVLRSRSDARPQRAGLLRQGLRAADLGGSAVK